MKKIPATRIVVFFAGVIRAVTQRFSPLTGVGRERRCVTTENNGCEGDYDNLSYFRFVMKFNKMKSVINAGDSLLNVIRSQQVQTHTEKN